MARVAPGRLDEVVNGLDAVAPVALRLGATGLLVALTHTGGSTAGHLVVSVAYDDFATHGRAIDRARTDPEARAVRATLERVDGPLQVVSTVLLQRLAL